MFASPGDRVIVKGHTVDEPDRDCEVLEVHSDDGGPPYLVRWSGDGHESLFFPGSDATIQHFATTEPAPASAPDQDDAQKP